MLRDQVINFLEAAVVLLMLTNVLSFAAATYALAIAHRMSRVAPWAAAQPLLAPLQRWPQLGKPMQ